jgi:hypothetical protein
VDESFDLAIKDHLELQRRNRMLEPEMPLEHYIEPGSLEPGSLEPSPAAVSEDTQEWVMPEAIVVAEREPLLPPAEDLWAGTPAFDWGD